jgi:hypothetical protein
LRNRDGHVPALPSDQHEHVVLASIFGRQAPTSTVFSPPERRHRPGSDAPRPEKGNSVCFQVVEVAPAINSASWGTHAVNPRPGAQLASYTSTIDQLHHSIPDLRQVKWGKPVHIERCHPVQQSPKFVDQRLGIGFGGVLFQP